MKKQETFEVIDKRHSARQEEVEKSLEELPIETPVKAAEDKPTPVRVVPRKPIDIGKAVGSPAVKFWSSYAFTVIMIPLAQKQILTAGRCVGVRSDGPMATADVLFTPIWEEGFDWTRLAKQRLDSYLLCQCSPGGYCGLHRGENPWFEEDMLKIQQQSMGELPEALALLQKAEHARQSRIVIPRSH